MYPASSVSDLSEIDSAVKGMEIQVQKIRDRLREETQAIPKAKVFQLCFFQKINASIYLFDVGGYVI